METWLLEWIGTWYYLAPFVALVVAGFGFPMPEEITLLASGIAVRQGRFDFVLVALVCGLAILIGDSVPFLVGRHLGMGALRSRWVRFALPPDRLERLQGRFGRHGNKAVFGCRFLTGARLPGYFMAGSLGMGYGRFLLLNGLGVCITVPVTLGLGWSFADRMQGLQEGYEGVRLFTVVLLALLGIVLTIRSRRRRRAGLDAARAANAGEPADAPERSS